MAVSITKDQAKQFLLRKQLFLEEPKSGYEGIAYVFNKIRIIQYDPLNPCGRNPDLVLQSRINDYHPNDYYKWLYGERKGIECYDKLLCIIPIEDFPLTSHNRSDEAFSNENIQLLKDKQKELEELLQFIDKNGPVSSADIENKEVIPGRGWRNDGLRWGKVALELLWKTGRIVISRRVGANKFYDLPLKVYKNNYFLEERQIEEEHILRRIGSVGIMRIAGSTDAWRGVGPPKQKTEIVRNLIKKGILTEVVVEGVRTKYVILTADKDLLYEQPQFRDEMLFIAPLDTLIWDRHMIKDFFGFQYKWEVYDPPHKRKYGYYVLPILYKDQFVGRIEPVFQNNTLIIKNVWKEEGIEWTEEMDAKLEETIEKFRKYLRI